MGSIATLRFRRSAAQMHAIAQLEREIRATDPHLRRKYLRDFSAAFRDYEAVLDSTQLPAACSSADFLLVGDYHALAASQRFAADILRQLAASGREVVLGLELVFARDQDIVDEWRRGEIDSAELRERIRFEVDWGYDWQPYYELLEAGRAHATAVYGLDCMPRNDLRRIGTRDRHAATKLAEIRERHPQALVLVVFGESHLAPNHLPEMLRARRPGDRIVTLLQNIDSLYWRAAGERRPQVEAVRVSEYVLCAFNSTPLEKYESYRLCIERWRQERPAAPDLAPAFYNIVDALLRFLDVDKYSPSNGTQPRFLVDQLPEVYFQPSDERVRRLLARKDVAEAEIRALLARLDAHGCCYVPAARALLVREFQLPAAAEEAARFVHQACRGATAAGGADDRFYTRVLEEALGYFGSRAMCPARPPVREADLYALYSLPREAAERPGSWPYREFMELVDFLVMHKDYEAKLRQYRELPELLREGVHWQGERFAYAARQLGHILGSDLYDAYISGLIAKRLLRTLFFRHLDRPGAARTAYFATQRKLRRRKRVV